METILTEEQLEMAKELDRWAKQFAGVNIQSNKKYEKLSSKITFIKDGFNW
jgi:hypothetical protein